MDWCHYVEISNHSDANSFSFPILSNWLISAIFRECLWGPAELFKWTGASSMDWFWEALILVENFCKSEWQPLFAFEVLKAVRVLKSHLNWEVIYQGPEVNFHWKPTLPYKLLHLSPKGISAIAHSIPILPWLLVGNSNNLPALLLAELEKLEAVLWRQWIVIDLITTLKDPE